MSHLDTAKALVKQAGAEYNDTPYLDAQIATACALIVVAEEAHELRELIARTADRLVHAIYMKQEGP